MLIINYMALINSKYVADILNHELEDKNDKDLIDNDTKKKYKTFLELYLEDIDNNRTKNIISVVVIVLIIYPILFFFN